MSAQHVDLFSGVRVQICAVPSCAAVITRRPSDENAAVRTSLSWPRRMARFFPEAASQMRAVVSADAVTIFFPSGENAAV